MHHAMRHLLATLVLLAGAATLPGSAHAAQSYDNCTGFIDSVPATITTQGVWCLRKDLSTNVTSGAAIAIAANNVTIDCNDFKLGGLGAGDSSDAKGIWAANRQNATVRHCNVRGFYYGIDLDDGAGHLVEDNRLDNNLFIGIQVFADNSLIQRNRVYDTGGRPSSNTAYGIATSADVIGNTVEGVITTGASPRPYGIYITGSGRVARNNNVRGLLAAAGMATGIYAIGPQISLDGNQVTSPAAVTGTGIQGNSSFCRNNTVAGFSTAASSCQNVGGNAGF